LATRWRKKGFQRAAHPLANTNMSVKEIASAVGERTNPAGATTFAICRVISLPCFEIDHTEPHFYFAITAFRKR
jgi:hypothetical protein